ncbi:hypothetical protein BJX61DRAFT_354865 [Aspergillus egyptiacus]|nr:hypothetical protein BJX61DRAFT_354865 [Aspergillus egyptiacus]
MIKERPATFQGKGSLQARAPLIGGWNWMMAAIVAVVVVVVKLRYDDDDGITNGQAKRRKPLAQC